MEEDNHLRKDNESEESILKNVKSESVNEKKGESIESNDKKPLQKDTKTGIEQYRDNSSSSTDEPIIGKHSREGGEIENSSAKKIKSEADIKKDGDGDVVSNEEKVQHQKRMITRKEEESHFLRLFTYVLNTIMAIKNVSDDDVSEMMPILIDSFKPTQTFHEFHFNQWKNICAFLYRYASHGAGFARYRILNGIRNCQVLESALRKPDLRVICLGSGAGNDAVGLCSALSELQFPKRLKLFLVDKFQEWSLCNKLAKVFIEEENFGKVSELFQKTNVELSFIHCDLPGNLESDKIYFEILGEADVIIMSKFLSSLDRSDDSKHERDIITVIFFSHVACSIC